MDRKRAEAAVRAIVADLSDRRGLKSEWDGIDDDIRAEIEQRWVELILAATEEQWGEAT